MVRRWVTVGLSFESESESESGILDFFREGEGGEGRVSGEDLKKALCAELELELELGSGFCIKWVQITGGKC